MHESAAVRTRASATLALLSLSVLASWLDHGGVGGLLEGNAPDTGSVLVHLVVPPVLAVAVVGLRRASTGPSQLLTLLACVVLAELLRWVRRWGLDGGQGVERVLFDSKVRWLATLSLATQGGVAVLALAVVRLRPRWARRR